MTQKKLEWKTVQRKVNDLLPLEINPRKISAEKLTKLRGYLEKFNVVEIPVINFDSALITWHQRLKVMQLLGRGEEIIDVRIPNRQLTDVEIKEYNLIGNTHVGEFDIDILMEEFSDIELSDFDIELPDFNEPGKIKTETLKPFFKTHVLLSFPPERMIEVQDILNLLKEKDFIEYETSSN
jgi:hypothetical protein